MAAIGAAVPVIMAWVQHVPIWALILIGVGGFAVFLFAVLAVVLAWDRFWQFRATKSNKELVKSWIKLSKEIVVFLVEQERRDRAFESFPGNMSGLSKKRRSEEWARMNREMLIHFRDTRTGYAEKFGGRVEVVKMQLEQRGLLTKNFDLWAHDTNPRTMKDAAHTIRALSHQYAERCGIDLSEDF